MSETSKLNTAAILAGIATIFSIAIFYVPLANLLILFLPVPFIVCGIKTDFKWSVCSAICAGIISGLINGIFTGFAFFVVFFFPGVLMGCSIKKQRNMCTNIFWGVTGFAIGSIIISICMSVFFNVDIVNTTMESIKKAFELRQDVLKETYINIDDILTYMEMIIPSSIIIYGIIVSFINYFMAASVLKTKNEKALFCKLKEFSFPGNMMFGVIFMYCLSYLLKYINGIYFETLMLNMQIVFIIMFFLQGIALYSYLLDKMKIKKAFKNALLFFSIFMQPIPIIISMLGVVDCIFNFRRIRN